MAKAAMTGVHTAGIYADMTVDGPDIGTLVVIVDRARNLPNRKTMGKQDPYCAARLGKEAKRTETDKRGGQTPRWDQELRFTVHDSLDYHQLKVSIFNEDKRTDLIGETWVPLDKVLVPGGGQSDTWHSLNCKGRYAGEIRIELTYYDTRPKEERSRAPSEAAYPVDGQERALENVGGSRQPQSAPVKRRPLPTDPTLSDPSPTRPAMPDHAQSSPLPYVPSQTYQNRPRMLTTPQSAYDSTHHAGVDHQLGQVEHQGSQSMPFRPQNDLEIYEEAPYLNQSQEVLSLHYNQQSSAASDRHLFHNGYTTNHKSPCSANRVPVPYPTDVEDSQLYPFQETQNCELDLPKLPPYNPRVVRPVARKPREQGLPNDSLSSPIPSLCHDHYIPDSDQRNQLRGDEPRYSGTLHHNNDSYNQSSLRHHSHENRYSSQSSPLQHGNTEDGPPPPPPVHRNSGHGSPNEIMQRASLSTVSAPAPLNIRHGRNSICASPLSQSYSDAPGEDYVLSASPASTQTSTFPAPALTPYQNYALRRGRSHDLNDPASYNQHGPTTPSSLTAGYDPIVAEAESQRTTEEQQPQTTRNYGRMRSFDGPSSQSSQTVSPHGSYSHIEVPYRNEDLRNRASHRSSVPVVKPGAVSPDPRTPMRKSVSPHPQSALREGALPGIPFSPDSYEALNPNIKSATNVNKSGPTYKTPEQARDAFRQKAQEQKLEEGPIIGSDGRVIDPSDHLPTETWAPEPEQKPPRKGPEITFRFRQSPLGAQPMPNSSPRPPRETVIRPHSIATTVHSYSGDATSPSLASRNRLQKRTRLSPTHANSSPVLPTNNSTPSSTYPLREHVNYGLNGSPGYPGSSPSAPPPVPAKVPLATGQEDWGTDALSEEMRRIDIGVGSGTGRARRSKYGP